MVKSLTYGDLQSQINGGNIGSAYLFAGEELLLKRLILEAIKTRLFPKDEFFSLNYSVFYAEETILASVLDVARTLPFLAERRMIVVKNVEHFAADEKPLLDFLANPPSKTVFIAETEKNSQDKFIKKLIAACNSVMFSPLEGSSLEQWVEQFVRGKGKQIAQGAVSLLIDKLGNELDGVMNALEKVCVYAGKSKSITERDVEALVKKTREDTRFVFLNALMSKQTGKALTLAAELSRDGKNVAEIIGLINWQLKRAEDVRRLSDKGCSPAAIARQLKLSSYAVHKQSTCFTMKELQQGFRLLLEADIEIKKGLKSPSLALETLIVRLCAQA